MTVWQLAAIRARISGRLEQHTDVPEIEMAVADLRALLDEVDRLSIELNKATNHLVESQRNGAREAIARKEAKAEVERLHTERSSKTEDAKHDLETCCCVDCCSVRNALVGAWVINDN
jgi:seryl-tRNA synthetase